jgi:hypothetical protein
MKVLFTFLLVILLSLVSGTGLFANPFTPHGRPVGSYKPQAKKHPVPAREGVVVAIVRGIDLQHGRLDLETDQGRLRAQGAPAKLKHLRVGDKLLVWVTPDAIFL